MFTKEEILIKLEIILEKTRKLFHFLSVSTEIISAVRFILINKYKIGPGKAKHSGTTFL
jgi:hypothetical protein